MGHDEFVYVMEAIHNIPGENCPLHMEHWMMLPVVREFACREPEEFAAIRARFCLGIPLEEGR